MNVPPSVPRTPPLTPPICPLMANIRSPVFPLKLLSAVPVASVAVTVIFRPAVPLISSEPLSTLLQLFAVNLPMCRRTLSSARPKITTRLPAPRPKSPANTKGVVLQIGTLRFIRGRTKMEIRQTNEPPRQISKMTKMRPLATRLMLSADQRRFEPAKNKPVLMRRGSELNQIFMP